MAASAPHFGNDRSNHELTFIDLIIAAIFMVMFGIAVWSFRYRGEFAEYDLYRVLVGLLDGEVSGLGIAGPEQFEGEFGFGYLAALYAFASQATLRDPDRLTDLMNQIGFGSMMLALPCLWWAVSLVHSGRAATVALIIFALAPMIPELATSGHQVIPMFAFLCAAAVLLFLPLSGWRAALAAVAAAVLLLAGLVVRGEIFLAFPWLVLSGSDYRSLRSFLFSAALRSLAPVFALVAFVVLQHRLVTTGLSSSVGRYFTEFYSWATIVPGFVYMAVGCGIATAAAGLLATLWLLWRPARGKIGWFVPNGYAALIGPIALVLVPLAFFLPNPQPTRHFMMPLAGLSILIALALTAWPARFRIAAITVAFALGAVNQVLAEAVRPALIRINDAHSPYIPVPGDYRTTTHANLGWEWERHAALVARRDRWRAMGDMIRTSCSDHTIVFGDEGAQLFSRLYAGGAPVDALGLKIGPFFGVRGIFGNKTVIVVEKMTGWPADAVATVLADPTYAHYRIFADPYTLTRYDKTPIPADWAATFGCGKS